MRDDESALVTAAADGDEFALEVLLLEYHDRLTQSVRRRMPPTLQRSVSPEDIVQEACIRAFRKIGDFTPDGDDAFYRWLSTIARHCLADAGRRMQAQKRGGGRGVNESVESFLQMLSARGKSPSRVIAGREAAQAVRVALAGLSDDYRQAIELRYIEGLSVAETAERMGRTDRAVQMLCHRALKKLEAAMGRASHYLSTQA